MTSLGATLPPPVKGWSTTVRGDGRPALFSTGWRSGASQQTRGLHYLPQAAPATASCATALRTRTSPRTRRRGRATAPTAPRGATPRTRREIRPPWPPQPLSLAPYPRCRANSLSGSNFYWVELMDNILFSNILLKVFLL